MKMNFAIATILFCCISVLRANYSIDVAKCSHDTENCEQFTFRQKSQTNGITNNTINVSTEQTNAIKDINLIEHRLAFERSDSQENGNCQQTPSIGF